jgi:hypothetical protein
VKVIAPAFSRRALPGGFVFAALLGVTLGAHARAQTISKGQQILINQGLQVQGMVTNFDPFHLSTYQAANYSSINWLWDSNVSAQGSAPGAMPWARWVRDHYSTDQQPEMPPLNGEGPYLSKLIALSLGDEPDLNDVNVRNYYVNWFNSVRAAYPNTILYTNNYGGQLTDAALGDFVTRAKPDMISFDSYPFQPGGGPAGGSPTNWYGDLRRYRVYAADANIPLAVYRQTFHDASDRDPAPSELSLLTFGALAFNAKYLTDFTYNSGASSLFNNAAGGDNSPNALYTAQAANNKQARNLGATLTRLQPIVSQPDGSQFTTDIMFIRGQHLDSTNTAVPNAVPIGFTADAQSPNGYTDWVFQRNDPYLDGWTVTNTGTKNNGLKGDVIVSWFKTLDEAFDGPNYSNEVYMMVTNGLTDPTGTGADTRQHITMDFLFGTAAGHLTALDVMDPNTGAINEVTLTSVGSGKYRWSFDLDGGSATLFKFADGAPFIGVAVPEPGSLVLASAAGVGLVVARRRRNRRRD